MSRRPSYIIWLHAETAGGQSSEAPPQAAPAAVSWSPPPVVLNDRWQHEKAAGATDNVFWLTPNDDIFQDSSGESLSRHLANALATAAKTEGVTVDPSVLFVWDSLDAALDYWPLCHERTKALCNIFRLAFDFNIGQLQQLARARLDILIRLAPVGRTRGSYNRQQVAFNRMNELTNPPDIGRASIRHIWLLGTNNVDSEHGDGLTIVDTQELDAMLAELLTVYLETDWCAGMDQMAAPGMAFSAVGQARLIAEMSVARRARAAQRGRELLDLYLDKRERLPADESAVRFLAETVPLTEDRRGLMKEGLGEVLLHPGAVLRGQTIEELSNLLQHVINMASLELDQDIEKMPFEWAFDAPARIMNGGRIMIAHELFAAARLIRAARQRLFIEVGLKMHARIGELLSDVKYFQLRQVIDTASVWRAWLKDEADQVEHFVREAIQGGEKSQSPWKTIIGQIVPMDPEGDALVPGNDPDPAAYYQDFVQVLAERPLVGALVSRAGVAAVLGGQALAVLGGDLNPFLINLPVLSSPWLLAPLAPLAIFSLAAFRLRHERLKRLRAKRALYYALIKHARSLLRDFLIQEMKTFYGDLMTYIGKAEEFDGQPADETAWRELGKSLAELKEEEKPQFARSLCAGLGRLRQTVVDSIQQLLATPARPEFQPSPWLTLLTTPEDYPLFPYLPEPGARLDPASEPEPTKILRALLAETKIFQQAWQALVMQPADVVQTQVADQARDWTSRTGYAYLTDKPISLIAEFLIKQKPAKLAEWRRNLSKAGHPYLQLGTAPRREYYLAHPPGEPTLWRQIAPDRAPWSAQPWGGLPGLLAISFHGPALATQIPELGIAFPEPKAEQVSAEDQFQE